MLRGDTSAIHGSIQCYYWSVERLHSDTFCEIPFGLNHHVLVANSHHVINSTSHKPKECQVVLLLCITCVIYKMFMVDVLGYMHIYIYIYVMYIL